MGNLKRTLTIVLSVALLASGALAFDKSTPPAQRNAILFSWDGAQRDHVNECLSRNELPNLA
ncbi:MAG: hypothetical protein ACPL7K_07120, partial [Armatimonadota bacterium]